MSFTKFPSIESFGHVWRTMNRRPNPEPVRYGAKIKLHGTNAGIRIDTDGTVTAQSRSRDITPEDDNAGFAAWVETVKGAFSDISFDDPVVFFGEWAGKGIQKTDAVTQLNDKYFFVFAFQVGNGIITDPWAIESVMPDIDNALILPWHMMFGQDSLVDFTKPEEANTFVDLINEKVEGIGECDPFIQNIFGVEGPGEGLVLMPVSFLGLERDEFSALTWKAKTEAHRVKKTDKAVSRRVEIPEGVPQFVETFVTEARCEQALMEGCEGVAEKPRTSDFLRWIGGDVKKESVAELEEMGLEWKQVAAHVNKAAVRWFMSRCERLAA